jgi:sulfur carrier protein ThiS
MIIISQEHWHDFKMGHNHIILTGIIEDIQINETEYAVELEGIEYPVRINDDGDNLEIVRPN